MRQVSGSVAAPRCSRISCTLAGNCATTCTDRSPMCLTWSIMGAGGWIRLVAAGAGDEFEDAAEAVVAAQAALAEGGAGEGFPRVAGGVGEGGLGEAGEGWVVLGVVAA